MPFATLNIYVRRIVEPEDSEQIKELDTEIGRGLYYRVPTELKAHIREFIFHSRPLSYTKGEEEKTDRIAQIYSDLVEKSNKP